MKRDAMVVGVRLCVMAVVAALSWCVVADSFAGTLPVGAPKRAWEGVKVAVLGDSISDRRLDWWHHWWEYLAADIGAEMHVYAANGSQWNGVPRQTDLMAADIGGKVDAILIFMGTNDFNANVPLGSWWSESRERITCNAHVAEVGHRVPALDGKTFRGRINVALDKIKRAYPDRQVVLITPLRRGYFKCSETNSRQGDSYSNEIGLYLADYVRAIREAGEVWSVPVIDVYSESGLIPELSSFDDCCNRTDTDRLHPSNEGHRRLALTVAARLKTLPPTFRAAGVRGGR